MPPSNGVVRVGERDGAGRRSNSGHDLSDADRSRPGTGLAFSRDWPWSSAQLTNEGDEDGCGLISISPRSSKSFSSSPSFADLELGAEAIGCASWSLWGDLSSVVPPPSTGWASRKPPPEAMHPGGAFPPPR